MEEHFQHHLRRETDKSRFPRSPGEAVFHHLSMSVHICKTEGYLSGYSNIVVERCDGSKGTLSRFWLVPDGPTPLSHGRILRRLDLAGGSGSLGR